MSNAKLVDSGDFALYKGCLENGLDWGGAYVPMFYTESL